MTQTTPRPIDRHVPAGTYQLVDVDHEGRTADGEAFNVEPNVYRNHARIEDVVIRYPCGKLALVKRVVPAKRVV